MRRLVAYLLILKYLNRLTSIISTDLIWKENITNGEQIDNFVAGTTGYTPNTLNQLVSTSNPNQTFTYDDDGNMTTGFTPEGYALTMTYDAENRMISAQYTDSSLVVHRTEYSYGGDSLVSEIKKYDNGVLQSTTRYLRAGFLPIQERDASNNIAREYTWGLNLGGGIGGLLTLKQNASDYFYLYDGKGNVSSLINISQSVVANYRYDAFGVLMKKTATIEQPYMFSTKAYDAQTGMYDFGFRYYMPEPGKWTTKDPLGEYRDINLYRVTGNNPVNWIDPWGLAPIGPPPVPVPGGGVGNGWKWNPNPQDKRGGKWGPKQPIPGQSQPSASWEDPAGDDIGHWDVDDGFGNRDRYDENGKPLTPEEAHGKRKCKDKGNSNDNSSEGNSGLSNSDLTNAQRNGLRNKIITSLMILFGIKTALGLGE